MDKIKIQNDPNKTGQLAANKVLFGYNNRYAIAPVHTRFDKVQWFVWDAEVYGDGLDNLIRQSNSYEEAIEGLGCEPRNVNFILTKRIVYAE